MKIINKKSIKRRQEIDLDKLYIYYNTIIAAKIHEILNSCEKMKRFWQVMFIFALFSFTFSY